MCTLRPVEYKCGICYQAGQEDDAADHHVECGDNGDTSGGALRQTSN